MASLYVPANTLGGMAHLHGESGEEQANSQEHRQFLHQGPFLKKFPAKRYNQLFQVSKFYVAPIQPFHPFDSKAPLAIQQNLTLVSYWTHYFYRQKYLKMSALTSAGLVGLQIWYHKKMVWSWKLGIHSWNWRKQSWRPKGCSSGWKPRPRAGHPGIQILRWNQKWPLLSGNHTPTWKDT